MLTTENCCGFLGEGCLPNFSHSTQSIRSSSVRQLYFVLRVSKDPDIHSSKMSWRKIAKASGPPCEPTPTCLIAVVRAAISPSLSAESHLDIHFRTTPSLGSTP